MDPKVSILIPVYNRQDLIGPCLESALAQTVKDIEIVACDNCSTDGTRSVLEEYARRDTRVRVLCNSENLGPVRNWERCIQEARAPYAKFLFSDDVMAEDYLEQTLPLIALPEVGLVFTACEIGEEPSNSTVRYRFSGSSGVWEAGRFLLGHVFAYDLPFSPGAALFHTIDLRNQLMSSGPSSVQQEFLRTGAGPDLLMLLQVELAHGRVAHIPDSLTFFRSHPGSITSRENEAVLSLYRRAMAWFLERNHPRLLRCYLSGIRWAMNGNNGTSEIQNIARDLGLTSAMPEGLGYMTDMSTRFLRSLHRRRGVQPYD